MGAAVSIRGVIIESRQHREQDVIIKILTGQNGIISACVPGAKKPSSRLAPYSVPAVFADFVCTQSKGFLYVKEAEIVEGFRCLYSSIEALTVASHLFDITNDVAMDIENGIHVYPVLLTCLYRLSKRPQDYRLVAAVFEWRVMNDLGFAFDLSECDCDHVNDMPTRAFSYTTGKLYCANVGCLKRAKEYKFISLGCIQALIFIQNASMNELFGFKLTQNALDDLFEVCHHHLCLHLDKNYNKMDLLDALPPITETNQ